MITLKSAQFYDYVAIAKIHANSWRQNYRGLYSDHFLNTRVEQDRLEIWYKRLQHPTGNQQVILATLDENIIGFACLYYNDDPVFGSYVDNLHVAAQWQQSGTGSLLIKECARLIGKTGESPKMYLWVYEANEKARRFYERLGGQLYETVEKETPDGGTARACRYIWNDVAVFMH